MIFRFPLVSEDDTIPSATRSAKVENMFYFSLGDCGTEMPCETQDRHLQIMKKHNTFGVSSC